MKECCRWSSQFSDGEGLQGLGVLEALLGKQDDSLRDRLTTLRRAPCETSDGTGVESDTEDADKAVSCAFCKGSPRLLTTPLHVAAEHRASKEAISALLSDVGDCDRFLSTHRYFDQRTPLSVAVSSGSVEAALFLIDATVSNSTLSDEVSTSPLLHFAAEHGMSDVVDKLCSLAEACDLDVCIDRTARVCGGSLTPLECALRSGHAATAKCILTHGADSRIGRPLLWAIRSGGECCSADVIDAILDSGCDINMLLDDESNQTTPLLCAAGLAYSTVVEMLLERGGSVVDKSIGGRSALSLYLCAVRYRPAEMSNMERVLSVMRLLAEQDECLLSQDEVGRTAFAHAFIQYRRSPHLTDVLSALLSNGDKAKAALNLADHDGIAPLHLALALNSSALAPDLAPKVTRMLLDAGADPNAFDGSPGRPPLLVALCNERHANIDSAIQLQLADILLQHGADPDEGDTIRTPLIAALLENDDAEVALRAMLLLMKHGANVNADNRHGETALHRCMKMFCSKNEWTLVEELLKYGADPNQRDNSGYNALHIAAQCMSAKGIHLLLRHGADINAVTQQGDTALHLLGRQPGLDVHQDLPAAFALLILAGCSTKELNGLGIAPLDHLTRTWIRCAELADRLLNKPLMLRDIVRANIRLLLHPAALENVHSVLGDYLPESACEMLQGDWLPEREVGGLVSDDDEDEEDGTDDAGVAATAPPVVISESIDDDDDFMVEGIDEDDDDDDDDNAIQFQRSDELE
ncbi:ankyrin-3-like [Sycon ciliatum]|uniref:ankyrin-3-like n=1 Tax=Sycon ciliatum TaxID=27933 RepID=UPI0031F69FAD